MVTFHLKYSLICSDTSFELPSGRGAPMAAMKAGHCGLAKQSQPPTKAEGSGLVKHMSSTATSR